MIIRPDFYRESRVDRRTELQNLGLDPDRPTGLVMFGGHGSRVMRGIARRLDDTQLILICGHNAALAQRLRAMAASAPRLVLGFTSEIRRYMQLSDFFIGKPGPGSISEAVQQGLPVIVVRNTWTMPQERYNTDWVRENNAGHRLGVVQAHPRRRRAGHRAARGISGEHVAHPQPRRVRNTGHPRAHHARRAPARISAAGGGRCTRGGASELSGHVPARVRRAVLDRQSAVGCVHLLRRHPGTRAEGPNATYRAGSRSTRSVS